MPPRTDEIKRLLLENIELTRENNRLLKKLRRAEITKTIFHLIYWVVIIVLPLYLYYTYLGPYLQDLRESYDEIKAQADAMQNLPAGFGQYLDKLEAILPKSEEAAPTPDAATSTLPQ